MVKRWGGEAGRNATGEEDHGGEEAQRNDDDTEVDCCLCAKRLQRRLVVRGHLCQVRLSRSRSVCVVCMWSDFVCLFVCTCLLVVPTAQQVPLAKGSYSE